jgi:alpha-L-rhamnosidase
VDVLIKNHRSDVLLDMLSRTDAPSYGNQLAVGATSLTETWDANPTSSQDHLMLGDGEEWFYRGLGGIDVDLARRAASRIVLSPAVLAPIRWVRTSYNSALGRIESNWLRGATQTVYDFTIPANATATIELETANPRAVKVNGVEASKAAGAISTNVGEGSVSIVVGSGHYQIRAANPRQE